MSQTKLPSHLTGPRAATLGAGRMCEDHASFWYSSLQMQGGHWLEPGPLCQGGAEREGRREHKPRPSAQPNPQQRAGVVC